MMLRRQVARSCSLSHLPRAYQNFCTAEAREAPPPLETKPPETDPPDLPPSTTPAQRPLTRSQLRRGKTLFELADLLPNRGLGVRFRRDLWVRNGYENTFWTVTRIRESIVGEHGWPIYYGKQTWKGIEGNETRIKSGFKRGWEFLQNEKGEPRMIKAILIAERPPKEKATKHE